MLNPDFRDMLSCLKGAGVEFIVVGAYALAAHGRPRATGDIDIRVRSSPENAQKVISALEEFGAPLSNLAAEDFTVSDLIVQLGIEPCRIDILTGIDGLDFDEGGKISWLSPWMIWRYMSYRGAILFFNKSPPAGQKIRGISLGWKARPTTTPNEHMHATRDTSLVMLRGTCGRARGARRRAAYL